MDTNKPTTQRDIRRLPPRGGSYQNILLAVLFCTFGFVFFDRLALNYLAPYWMPELGLDNTALGLLGGIPALSWAVSGLLLGYISDRIDRRKPLLVFAVIGFTIFSALSGFVGGLTSLVFLRGLMGICEGGVLPLSQTLMLFSSSEKRRGLNMGLLQGSSAGLLGGVLGPIVTVAMAEAWGWRAAFFFTVIPGVVLALLVLFSVKELRFGREVPASSVELGVESVDELTAPTSSIPIESRPATFRQAIRHRNIILSLLIAVFFITWFITTQTFTPTYLAGAHPEWNSGELTFALTGIGAGWVLWGALVPAISDRIGRKPSIIIFALIASAAPILIVSIDSPVAFFFGMVLTYTGMGCFSLYMATIPAETVAPMVMASCLGLIMGVGEIGGGFIAPWIGGIIADSYGLPTTFYVCTAAAVIVAILACFLQETSPVVARRKGLNVSGASAA